MHRGLSKLEKNQACDLSKVPCKICPIYQSSNFYFDPLSKVSSSNYLIGSLKKIGCLGQSLIALWVEGGSITGAVFGMTVLHQNMTNDRAPPKFKK